MLRNKFNAALLALLVAAAAPGTTLAAYAASETTPHMNPVFFQTSTAIIGEEVQTTEVADPIEGIEPDTVPQETATEEQSAVDVEPADVTEAPEAPIVEPAAVVPTEEPIVTGPAIVAEEVVIEPAIIVEEAVTGPAIIVEPEVATPIEEPTITGPAIVVEEVVTEAAILVEPVAATLTILYHGEYAGIEETMTEKVEGYNVGDTVDLAAYIDKILTQPDLIYIGDIQNVTVDNEEMNIILNFTLDSNKISEEEFLNTSGKGADDYE